MKYQIAAYDNPMEAQKKQLAMLEKPKSTPEEYLLRSPIWTTWARYKTDINQNKVLEFAKEIIANKYPFSVMEIDDKWSSAHGDLEFNSTLFPGEYERILFACCSLLTG
jgi:alpha-galactosidase